MAEQLQARFDPRQYRIDVRQAPLLRPVVAHDAAQGRWLLLLLLHHLAVDHTTLEVMQRGDPGASAGAGRSGCRAPLPFRNFVAQARLGVSREEHEAFFRRMLGDVEEPTAPFGLLDVQGDGSGIEEAACSCWRRRWRERLRACARRLGVSAASLCHLAWAQVLARVSGREDVVFGTVLFGRMQGGAGARPGAGAVHQHAAGADSGGRGGRGGERAADARAAGGAAAARARVAGAGAALQRGAGAAAAVLGAVELPPQRRAWRGDVGRRRRRGEGWSGCAGRSGRTIR